MALISTYFGDNLFWTEQKVPVHPTPCRQHRSKTACNAAISACSKAAAWTTAFSLFDHMALRPKKNPMGPRVFWFKADDFGSVLLPEADLLRMVFFGVFWIWIRLRC